MCGGEAANASKMELKKGISDFLKSFQASANHRPSLPGSLCRINAL
jgi:hypothetical protein